MPKTREIVRISNKDIDGDTELRRAFKEIKGIGKNLSESLAHIISDEIDKGEETPIKELSEEEIEKAEEIVDDPQENGVPAYLLNRRRDRKTGENKHLTEADLKLQKERDIDFMKSIRSYRGVRHMYGLRVRGQKTQSTGRTGETIGVKKEKEKPGEEE